MLIASLCACCHLHSEQHKQFLRSQQQRLLLLRHASKCTAPIGKCTATPFCGPMKQLWPHLATCKANPCPVKHCVSSRYVLSHYHRCKRQCEVCTPVRDAIKRNNEKVRVPRVVLSAVGRCQVPSQQRHSLYGTHNLLDVL